MTGIRFLETMIKRMERLVWKLLGRQLSYGQLGGFFVANLLGMAIVLLSVQFYWDVLPVFTRGDSFMKESYLVVSKKVTAVQTLQGGTPGFSAGELEDLAAQPFVRSMAPFVPAQFDVVASLGNDRMGIGFTTEMFFEAVPDKYIDADLETWHYASGSDSLSIILPRNYLNLYNFGFAASRGLPPVSEGLVGMLALRFRLRGEQGEWNMAGRVVGFSDRLNTILVPQSFMDEANRRLSSARKAVAARVIVEVGNPADEAIARYLSGHNYQVEAGGDDLGRMAYFLRLIIAVVLGVGLVICALSFYVLLLSIYLLLQKHTEKIDNLLLMGYPMRQVALPFHLLSLGAHFLVLVLSLCGVAAVRDVYLLRLVEVYPQLSAGPSWPVLVAGVLLFLLVSLLSFFAVNRKIRQVWFLHRKR